MKKLGLGIIGLVIAIGVYFFTAGSEQLTAEMKMAVSKQLTSLQTQGFEIGERTVEEKKEHFVLTFNEMSKIATFFTDNGAKISAKDAEVLKGLKIGVDVNYIPDTYSAASFDIYPLTLPTSITEASLDEEEKSILNQVTKLLEKKTFLIHANVNKLGNGFKGYMKDIHEVIVGDEKFKVDMTAFTFTGDLKENKLSGMTQTLKELSLLMEDDFYLMFKELDTSYSHTGTNKYDYDTDYTMKELKLGISSDFILQINNLSMTSTSKVKDNLVAISLQSKIASVILSDKKKETSLNTIVYNMKADNFDATALKKLEKIGSDINSDNIEEIKATFQQLVAKGVHFEIEDFSTKNIVLDKQKIDGFTLTTSVDLDKSFDLSVFDKNPLAALGAFNADLDLTISNGLFSYMAKQPQAMMAMMFIQPKDVNGDKVYQVRLKDGALKVNDKPMM